MFRRLFGEESFGEIRSFTIDGEVDCVVDCAGFSAGGLVRLWEIPPS